MSTRKVLTTGMALIGIMLLLTGCGNNKAETSNVGIGSNADALFNNELSEDVPDICGSWGYIYDKETAVAVFYENGTARYEGKDYSYVNDNQFIWLKDAGGEMICLRYIPDDEGIYLFKSTTYTFSGEGKPNGLVGEWSCTEKNWSFTFTNTGTFLEDGYFPGSYTVDSEKSTFSLMYKDDFEDTTCYFQLDGNQLIIEYPWRMVKTSTK